MFAKVCNGRWMSTGFIQVIRIVGLDLAMTGTGSIAGEIAIDLHHTQRGGGVISLIVKDIKIIHHGC